MQIVNDELIKKWEALKLEAYLPTPNDVWTIGWGHTHSTTPGMTITKEQAQMLFDKDVAWVEDAIEKYVKVPLTQNQYDAIASWVFNVGEGAFRKSTLLRKLNAGDYEGAAQEFPRWNKQKGKVLRGLTRRRAEEMEYFLSDQVFEAENAQTIDAPNPFHNLGVSKEMWGGATAAVGGLTALLGELGDMAQTALVIGLVGAGLFVMGNRLYARYKAKR